MNVEDEKRRQKTRRTSADNGKGKQDKGCNRNRTVSDYGEQQQQQQQHEEHERKEEEAEAEKVLQMIARNRTMSVVLMQCYTNNNGMKKNSKKNKN